MELKQQNLLQKIREARGQQIRHGSGSSGRAETPSVEEKRGPMAQPALKSNIHIALIARGTTVLAEHVLAYGDFVPVSRRILQNLADNPPRLDGDDSSIDSALSVASASSSGLRHSGVNERSNSSLVPQLPPILQSYSYDDCHHFSILITTPKHPLLPLTLLCMQRGENTRHSRFVGFTFLQRLLAKAKRKVSLDQLQTMLAYGLDKQLSPVIQKLMRSFNLDPPPLPRNMIGGLIDNLDEIHDILADSLNFVLDKDIHLDSVVTTSQAMVTEAAVFQKASKKKRSMMRRKSFKFTCIIIMPIVALALVLSTSICGWDYSKCRKGSEEGVNVDDYTDEDDYGNNGAAGDDVYDDDGVYDDAGRQRV